MDKGQTWAQNIQDRDLDSQKKDWQYRLPEVTLDMPKK